MSQRNPRAGELFLQAVEIHSADERREFLDKHCAGDESLRAEVESLLAASATANDVLEIPAGVLIGSGTDTTDDSASLVERPGTSIGRYKLLEQIGEGGFGLVYVAEQQAPIRRRVALKIIKPGMDTREVIARFEQERQALAMMDHPHIAKVFDAGTTASGRPYFVMELVKGVPITDYCDQAQLSPRQRLDLFVAVCQAIQHAHQKGIIHRDIKPSNVLVTVQEGRPVVKVIDFGVAKALNQQLSEHTIYTQFAQMIGTPLYMSPEQAEMNSLDIDTRSDIYSLGVLLYVLLTGNTPFDRQRLVKAALDEVRRIIREEEPPKPSTRLSESGERLASIAAQRKTEPAKLSKLVRGELDWIVMKCLEKDRTRRYETANGLARDVERYLADEPVEAGPPSTMYRLSKFARRNKRAFAAAALIAAMVLALVTGSLIYARQQQHLATERTKLAQDKQRLADDKERSRQKVAADLFDSLIRQSEALRLARQPGYRTEVFQKLHAAADLEFPGKNLDRVHEQVLACLGDPLGLPPIEKPADICSIRESTTSAVFLDIMDKWSGSMTSPDEQWLALYSADKSQPVHLVNQEGRFVAKVSPQYGGVQYVDFTANSEFLVLACQRGTTVLTVPDLKPHLELNGAEARWIATHPHLPLMAIQTGPSSERIEIHSLATQKLLTAFARPDSVTWVQFSRDGQRLLGADKNGDVALAWPMQRAPERLYLPGHIRSVVRVVFSPDGSLLASGAADKTVRVCNARTGLLRWSVPLTDEVRDLAFSPDGRWLSSVDATGEIKVWDVSNGTSLATATLVGYKPAPVIRLLFDSSGQRLIAGGPDKIQWWSLAATRDALTLSNGGTINQGRVGDLALHPDGNQLAILTLYYNWGGETVQEPAIYLCEFRDQAVVRRANLAPYDAEHSLGFNAAGTTLRFLTKEGRLGSWAIDGGGLVAQSNQRFAEGLLAVTADDCWAAALGATSQEAIVCDLKNDRLAFALPHESSDVKAIDTSTDGRQVALGLADGNVSIWNLDQVHACLAEFNLSLPKTWTRDAPRIIEDSTAPDDERAFTYVAFGNYQQAIPLLEQGLRERQLRLGKEHKETIRWARGLAVSYEKVGRDSDAVSLWEDCLLAQEATLERDHPATIETRTMLFHAYRDTGQFKKAISLGQIMLDDYLVKLGDQHTKVLILKRHLGDALQQVGELAKSRELLLQSVQGFEAKNATDQLALSRNTLADTYFSLEDYNQSAAVRQKSVEFWKNVDPPDSFRVYEREGQLGLTLFTAGDYARAEGHLLNSYDGQQRLFPKSVGELKFGFRLVHLYREWNRPDELEKWLRKDMELKREFHPEAFRTSQSFVEFGTFLLNRERWNEAEEMLREALRIRQLHEPDIWYTFNTTSQIGGALLGQGKIAEAEPLLIAGYEGMQSRAGQIPLERLDQFGKSLERLIQLYQRKGDSDAAGRWRSKLDEHRRAVDAIEQQALAHSRDGEFDKAIPLLQNVVYFRHVTLPANDPQVLATVVNLSDTCRRAEEFDKGATVWRKTYHARLLALGAESRFTIDAENSLGEMLIDLGLYADAAPHLLASYRDAQTSVDVPPEWFAIYRQRLVKLHSKWQTPSYEESGLRLRVDVARAVHGHDSLVAAQPLSNLGQHLLVTLKKPDEAEVPLRECLKIREKHGPDNWTTFHSRSILGGSLSQQQKFAESEPLLIAGYNGLRERQAKIPQSAKYRIEEAARRLINHFDDMGKAEEAAKWRKELETHKKAAGGQ